ncbi:MAG TPA: PAS domain S-box protein [Acidimicrobiales bacterium]|nr:PAS domain S-box protein [Acidimicrobiales bacterium]
MDPDPLPVVIVDDSAEVRSLLRMQLRLSGRFVVVGEGSTGDDAVALASRHRPALLVLDASMPGMDGLQALPAIARASPETRVVMFSGFSGEDLEQSARSLGAVEFVQKGTPLRDVPSRLLKAATVDVSDATAPLDGAGTDDGEAAAIMSEHLERFRTVFEQAAIGMSTMTLTGTIVRVNKALTQMLGRTPSELVGRGYPDLSDGRGRAALAAAMELISSGRQKSAEVDHLVVDAGQHDLWIHSTLVAVTDGGGQPLYLFCQMQDVTDRREALTKLRASEERFRLLVEQVRDYAIFMLDPEGRIATWNVGAERMKGYRAEEIIGQHFRVFYPREVQEANHPEHELELAVRHGRYEEEGWRVRRDGSRFWANVVITALFDEGGTLIGFAKVTRDLTERGRAQTELQTSEAHLSLLVEQVRDYAIFMLDPQGRVSTWNLGAERMKGYAAQEIIGQHFRTFYPPELQEARHPEHELELAVRDGRYEEEGWRIRRDGSRFWANVVITALFDDAGNLAGFAKVTRDITERRAASQAREAAAAELAEANVRLVAAAEQTASFVAATAHELRSPITAMTGGADLLDEHWDRLDSEERRELLGSIKSGGARMRRLLGDLLLAARLEAGSFEFQLERVSLSEAVTEAVVGGFPGEALEVEVVGVDDLVVRADRIRLVQILTNLVTNAAKYGKPPITLEARPTGDTVVVRVSDAGSGVSADLEPRLFEKFSQAPGQSASGSGLGLFIVRELARGQGGDAWFERGERGPCFAFSLPAAPG